MTKKTKTEIKIAKPLPHKSAVVTRKAWQRKETNFNNKGEFPNFPPQHNNN